MGMTTDQRLNNLKEMMEWFDKVGNKSARYTALQEIRKMANSVVAEYENKLRQGR